MSGVDKVAVHTGCIHAAWSVYKIYDYIMPMIRYVDD